MTDVKRAEVKPQLDPTHLYFYSEIGSAEAQTFNAALRKMVEEREKQAASLRIPLKLLDPIGVHIHSYGGKLVAGFSMCDTMRQLQTRVQINTHVEGGAASAATLLSVMGNHRTIGENSFILIHQLSSGHWGTYEELKDSMKNSAQFMDQIKGIYKKYTKMTKKQIDEILKHDLWLSASKALELGLVDEIV